MFIDTIISIILIVHVAVCFILLHHCTGDLDDGDSLGALIISMEAFFEMDIVAALLVMGGKVI